MITQLVQEFFLNIQDTGALMGIDYGEKRTGIAISDPSRKVSMPLKTINVISTQNLIIDLRNIIIEKRIVGIIIGLPILQNAKISTQSHKVKTFAYKIQQELELPILLYDERFTSRNADKLLAPIKKSMRTKLEDSVCASIILDNVLLSLRHKVAH